MAGIYMASKAKHGLRWRALREDYPIISTWIDECGLGETQGFSDLWERVVREVSSASVVIVYHEPGETMKGALVELGVALGCDVPVLWVAPEPAYTAVHHPAVRTCDTLEQALHLAQLHCELFPTGRSA